MKRKHHIRKWKRTVAGKGKEWIRPLEKVIAERSEAYLQRKKENISEKKAVKWVANALLEEAFHYSEEPLVLIVAEGIHREHHSGCYCIGDSSFRFILKKRKQQMGWEKFRHELDFQKKVCDRIQRNHAVRLTEKEEVFSLFPPQNYQKTCEVKLII